MRLLLIFIALAVLVLVPFFIWGDSMTNLFSSENSIAWLRRYESMAWLAAMILLMGDLFLPLPGTVIMSAVGYIYGLFFGGIVNVAGSFLAGSLAYWLCRMLGQKTAIRLLGEKDYHRGVQMSDRIGVWIVMLSRWLPVFPEVVSCMAGLTRMNAVAFHAALACGSIPLGFAYAYIGSTGVDYPWLAVVLSVCVPPLIWMIIHPVMNRKLSGQ